MLFHQSGGCCDGSSPMCYPQGEFLIGDNDVKLGDVGVVLYQPLEITGGGMFRSTTDENVGFYPRSQMAPFGL